MSNSCGAAYLQTSGRPLLEANANAKCKLSMIQRERGILSKHVVICECAGTNSISESSLKFALFVPQETEVLL
jgi:hypothetical protein